MMYIRNNFALSVSQFQLNADNIVSQFFEAQYPGSFGFFFAKINYFTYHNFCYAPCFIF